MMGVINLDKPVGPTSHDMVGLIRRLTRMRRIGHAGTLDPLASGVLPILIGPATRFSEELTGGHKRYEATIRLGWRSATDDGEGPLERGAPPLPAPEAARDALEAFVGPQDQRPPAFSARKVGGQTAYRVARAGAQLDLPTRRVLIERIDLLGSEVLPDASTCASTCAAEPGPTCGRWPGTSANRLEHHRRQSGGPIFRGTLPPFVPQTGQILRRIDDHRPAAQLHPP